MQFHHILVAAVALFLAVRVEGSPSPTFAQGPVVSVLTPSADEGDWGAARGNVWDMDSLNDVRWAQPDASGRRVSYSVATDVPGAYGAAMRGVTPQGSDLVTAFHADANTGIPSGRYHHLLYRLWIAGHRPGERGIEWTNGRVLYSTEWPSNDAYWMSILPYRRNSGDVVVCGYDRWCLYYIDLASPGLGHRSSPNPWDWGQPGVGVKALGIWPHENWATPDNQPSGDSPDYFYLDFVYLTGEIVARTEYQVRWNVEVRPGQVVTTSVYYRQLDELRPPSQSPDCQPDHLVDWTWLTSTLHNVAPPSPIDPGTPPSPLPQAIYVPLVQHLPEPEVFTDSFTWNVSGLTDGKVYYVCVVATDNRGAKSAAVSSAPVIKVPAPAEVVP